MPGVDLADLELLGGRVAVGLGLDDALDARRPRRARRARSRSGRRARVVDHRRRGAAARVRLDELARSPRRSTQRHVAAEHDHRRRRRRADASSCAIAAATAPPVPFGSRLHGELDALAAAPARARARASRRRRPARRRPRARRAPATAPSAARTARAGPSASRERMRVPWPAARIRTVGARSHRADASSPHLRGEAGGQGFEPRFSGPKPDVLPLDDPPRAR